MKKQFKIQIIYFLLIFVFFSCQAEINSEVGVFEKQELIFTDSFISSEFGIKVKLNVYDLFDTAYHYNYHSCLFNKRGTRFIHSAYEKPVQVESDWNNMLPDSVIRLTVYFDNYELMKRADENYLSSMYERKKATRIAQNKSNTEPVFGNAEVINGQQFCYLFFSDTTKKDSKYFIEANLTAHTFISTIQITFEFDCLATDCSGIDEKFLKILRSVVIENPEYKKGSN